MRLCLLRTDRLGDTVLTLPAIADLRASIPEAHVELVCGPGLAPLLALAEGLDGVRPWKAGTCTAGLRRRWAAEGCAGAALLNGPANVAVALWRAGVPVRAGRGRKWYSVLFNQRDAGRYTARGIHEAEANRAIVATLVNGLGRTPLRASAPARLRLDESLRQRGAAVLAAAGLPSGSHPVVLQPGSGGSSLDWPAESMIAVGRRLQAEGVPVAVHLGPGDHRLTELSAGLPHFGHDLDLPGLAAVLSHAACLVGNSTGPLHLAAALGRPVVGLYPRVRSLTPERWGPLGNGHAVLQPPGDGIYGRKADAPADHMASIDAERVLAAVRERCR
jgi:ADP-heptose:LPS heptosyltransferase